MPKKPRFKHPVRKVREIIREMDKGMNQDKFARLIGISPSLLNAIEAGQRKLTPEVAALIGAATGVEPDSLMSKKGRPLVEIDRDDYAEGGAFSSLSYSWWKESLCSAREYREHRGEAVRSLSRFLMQAFKKKKLRPALLAFKQWLKATTEQYGL